MADTLRLVRFDDPYAFLEATKQFDDSFMNFCIGSLRDHLSGPKDANDDASPVYLFGVYQEDDLL